MLNSSKMNERVHVIFPLAPDADGYPPASSERMWAKQISSDTFEIDNIPFFVVGISSGDKIIAKPHDDALFYESIKELSGNSTLRVSVSLDGGVESISVIKDELVAGLKHMGCDVEVSHIPNLVAVNVPPAVSLHRIIQFLKQGSTDNKWDYEEASLRQ